MENQKLTKESLKHYFVLYVNTDGKSKAQAKEVMVEMLYKVNLNKQLNEFYIVLPIHTDITKEKNETYMEYLGCTTSDMRNHFNFYVDCTGLSKSQAKESILKVMEFYEDYFSQNDKVSYFPINGQSKVEKLVSIPINKKISECSFALSV